MSSSARSVSGGLRTGGTRRIGCTLADYVRRRITAEDDLVGLTKTMLIMGYRAAVATVSFSSNVLPMPSAGRWPAQVTLGRVLL